MTQIHATALQIDNEGVLLRGPSGAGKSDLALRLIEQGATLISDDRVELMAKGPNLTAFAPPTLEGLLEIRNLGIIKLQHGGATNIRMVVDLVSDRPIERMPTPQTVTLEGIELPLFVFNPFEASTPAKLSLALAISMGHIERIE